MLALRLVHLVRLVITVILGVSLLLNSYVVQALILMALLQPVLIVVLVIIVMLEVPLQSRLPVSRVNIR